MIHDAQSAWQEARVPKVGHGSQASTLSGSSGKLCFSLKMRAALSSQGQRSDDRAAFGKRGGIFLEALLSQCIPSVMVSFS